MSLFPTQTKSVKSSVISPNQLRESTESADCLNCALWQIKPDNPDAYLNPKPSSNNQTLLVVWSNIIFRQFPGYDFCRPSLSCTEQAASSHTYTLPHNLKNKCCRRPHFLVKLGHLHPASCVNANQCVHVAKRHNQSSQMHSPFSSPVSRQHFVTAFRVSSRHTRFTLWRQAGTHHGLMRLWCKSIHFSSISATGDVAQRTSQSGKVPRGVEVRVEWSESSDLKVSSPENQI